MSRYTIYVTPEAWREIQDLPGHMRQRAKRAIQAMRDDPRPPDSKALETDDVIPELRRLRLDRWRVVYAISDDAAIIDVLAVRKRPPYDYGDLETLLANLR